MYLGAIIDNVLNNSSILGVFGWFKQNFLKILEIQFLHVCCAEPGNAFLFSFFLDL